MTEWLKKHWRKLAGGGLLLAGSAVAGKIAWPDAFSKALEGLAKMIMMCLILAVITAGCSSTSTTTTVKPDGTKITEEIENEKAFYDAQVSLRAAQKPNIKIVAQEGKDIQLTAKGVKEILIYSNAGSQGGFMPQHVHPGWGVLKEAAGIAGTAGTALGSLYFTYNGLERIAGVFGATSGTHINNSFNPTGANSPPTYGNSTPTFDDHRINNSYNDNSSQMHQDGE